MAPARQFWRREQPQWDPRRLVFIDETALNTKMARLYGWSRRGQRCVGAVPHGHWATSTLIAGLRLDRIDAPFLIEGSANMEVFAAYVGQVLCPDLQEGDEVIMDNLCIHKTPVVTRLITACGATVRFLPPYSPDLNPIEMAFAKLKIRLRPEAARTFENLQPAVARSVARFQADHGQGFFHHAQYGTNSLEHALASRKFGRCWFGRGPINRQRFPISSGISRAYEMMLEVAPFAQNEKGKRYVQAADSAHVNPPIKCFPLKVIPALIGARHRLFLGAVRIPKWRRYQV